MLSLLRPLDWDRELTEDGDGGTWTHFFFHLLTGPLKTVVAGPYLDDARLNLDPAPSIFHSSLSALSLPVLNRARE